MNRQRTLQLAFDLGTTTLGGRLIDLDGRTVGEASLGNPQREMGSDVIRRLEAARSGRGERLQRLLVEGMNDLLRELLSQAGAEEADLDSAAAAGNPAMALLLRRLPVDSLLFPPHRPAQRAGVLLDSSILGLLLDVPLFLFPMVNGYVGGDLVAFLYAQRSVEPGTLFIDIGTNGEMALFDEQGWLVTSVAAGPAFEGEGISSGMRYGPGAVTGMVCEADRLKLTVAGGGAPQGICGSGLIEVIAAAREAGLIDTRGTVVDPLQVSSNLSRYIEQGDEGRFLRLYRDARCDLVLTQEDIRQFQLGKGAIRAGVECLLKKRRIKSGDINEVLVTGALGLSMSAQVLKKVAILPENMVDRVRFVDGGVLEGVSRYLIDRKGPSAVDKLAAEAKSFPLSGTPTFEKAFLKALDF